MDKQSDSETVFEPFELDDKYTVSAPVKVGGMGIIYIGETKLMHHKVAIKILHAELAEQENMLLRFKLEAEIASSLNHPNIVNVFGSGVTADGKPYIAMDYVEGESLADLIARDGKIEISKCIDIFLQLARAVEYSHEKGVIHRDLKPSNVMLHPDEKGGFLVKLLDFGIAKSNSIENTIARELTLPGTVFGSVLYMSPEQVLGKEVDFRSDIYSFGCLLFHALTGKPPYESKVPVDCMKMHLNDSIPELSAFLPQDHQVESLALIINKCMEKAPAQRFESAALLRSALEKLNETEPAKAQPLAEPAAESQTGSAKAAFSREDGLAALSMILIAAVLIGVPYLSDLNLPRAQSKRDALEAHQKHPENKETALAVDKKVDILLDQAKNAIKERNLKQAEDYARQAYLTTLFLSPDDPKTTEALFFLGQINETRGNYQAALQAYESTLSSWQASFGAMAPQTIAVRQRLEQTQKILSAQKPSSPQPIKED